jgi:hypothetical protein
MITAVEKGRNLVLTVGDGDDAIVITVPPVPGRVGAAMLALWAGVLFAQSEQPETDAENMAKLAVGEENWPTVDELRYAESEAVVNAAIFWNVQGGGIDLVNEMLQDGYPKARQTLCERNGYGELYSQLQTLLSGGSGNPIPAPAGTPATGTPIGISGSFGNLSKTPSDQA